MLSCRSPPGTRPPPTASSIKSSARAVASKIADVLTITRTFVIRFLPFVFGVAAIAPTSVVVRPWCAALEARLACTGFAPLEHPIRRFCDALIFSGIMQVRCVASTKSSIGRRSFLICRSREPAWPLAFPVRTRRVLEAYLLDRAVGVEMLLAQEKFDAAEGSLPPDVTPTAITLSGYLTRQAKECGPPLEVFIRGEALGREDVGQGHVSPA